jgi:hypothetical protein
MGSTIITGMLIAIALGAHVPSTAAQRDVTIKDRTGVPVCIVLLPALASVDNPLQIDVRAPATPPSAVVAKLSSDRRDFSTLPITVFLVPSAPEAGAEARTPRQIQPLAVEPALVRQTIDGSLTDLFVRVTYPRDVLKAGVDVVAERTAVALNGDKVTSQTRCRITDADAAKWR